MCNWITDSALPPGARYRFTLLDDEGAPLTAWAFQVGGPLRVVGTIPADASTDVPATTGIEVTFDRDGVVLDPADVVVRRMTDGATVTGRLERHGRSIAFTVVCSYRRSGLRQLVFAPNSPELAATTQYLVQGALQQWLSDLISVEAVEVEAEESTLRVSVQYLIRSDDTRHSETFVRGGQP
jgi:hypothetical protein